MICKHCGARLEEAAEKTVDELLDMDERELSDYIASTTERRPELFDQPVVRPRKISTDT
jgi:hypothetical protein